MLLAALLAAPWSLRALSLVETRAELGLGDLRGIALDLAAALLVFALVAGLARLARWAALLAAWLWCAIHYANYETVRELGSLASLFDAGFLGDATFLLGSASSLSHPLVAALLLGLTGLAAWRGRRVLGVAVASAAVVGAALAVLAFELEWNDGLPSWRQSNVAVANAGYWWESDRLEAGVGAFRHSSEAMLDLDPSLAADLRGRERLPPAGRARNVLLVVVESLSGVNVPLFAEVHLQRPPLVLEHFDAIARRGLSFSTFVTHQRKTNRGMFALLCGELPNLGPATPKMTAYVARPWRTCLPQLLREEGYRTAFRQGAPLAFMLKGPFMERAGFDQVQGSESFDHAWLRNHWGVDDRTFFRGSLETIDALRAGDAPWFLALLTVGTHHPYLVPEGYGEAGRPLRDRAMRLADESLGEFVEALEARGVLDDTLVLITSDESAGALGAARRAQAQLALLENWGVLAVLAPGLDEAQRSDEIFGQLDLALSISDYLGLDGAAAGFGGRSVFRDYTALSPPGRWMYFANTNHLTVGAFDPEHRLILCRPLSGECAKAESERGRVFGTRRTPAELDPGRDDVVLQMAARSLVRSADEMQERSFALAGLATVTLPPGINEMVHGGQYLHVAPEEEVEVSIALRVSGGDEPIEIEHYVRSTYGWSKLREAQGALPLVRKVVTVGDGQTYSLRYRLREDRLLEGLQARTYARNPGSEPATLSLLEGEIRVRPRSTEGEAGDHPNGSGTRVERFELEPASGRGSLEVDAPPFRAEPARPG